MLERFFPRAERHELGASRSLTRIRNAAAFLEFGTELVSAEDRSLVALLGASPGASTAAFMRLEVIERCFPTN
jgi:malate dehydrogenase (quinone)